jgi:hypothetical protein
MMHGGIDRRGVLASLPVATVLGGRVAAAQAAPELYTDQHGLIVQRDRDGGDTAQREGWAWVGSWVRSNVLHDPWSVKRTITHAQAMAKLEVDQTGLFRRHPDQWNDTKDFSRDQTVPIIASMGLWGDRDRLERLWTRTKERNFLAQNGDLISPEYVNLFDRARDVAPGPIGDLQLGASVWTRIGLTLNNKDDVGDDLNLLILLLIGLLRHPTDATRSAAATYAKNRPISDGCYLQSYRLHYGTDLSVSHAEMRRRMESGIAAGWKPDSPRVLGALRWYFRAETGGNPSLAELYAPIVKRWFE